MKKYVVPEMEIEMFDTEDVIVTSPEQQTNVQGSDTDIFAGLGDGN